MVTLYTSDCRCPLLRIPLLRSSRKRGRGGSAQDDGYAWGVNPYLIIFFLCPFREVCNTAWDLRVVANPKKKLFAHSTAADSVKQYYSSRPQKTVFPLPSYEFYFRRLFFLLSRFFLYFLANLWLKNGKNKQFKNKMINLTYLS